MYNKVEYLAPKNGNSWIPLLRKVESKDYYQSIRHLYTQFENKFKRICHLTEINLQKSG
jgi:hypothetical protein